MPADVKDDDREENELAHALCEHAIEHSKKNHPAHQISIRTPNPAMKKSIMDVSRSPTNL